MKLKLTTLSMLAQSCETISGGKVGVVCAGTHHEGGAGPPIPDHQSRRNCPEEQSNDVVGDLKQGLVGLVGGRYYEFISGGMMMSHIIANSSEVNAQASDGSNQIERNSWKHIS